jgi:uncharacterized RDD family membrane protein YckC
MKRTLVFLVWLLLASLAAWPQPTTNAEPETALPPMGPPPGSPGRGPRVPGEYSAPGFRGPRGPGARIRRQHRGLLGLFNDIQLERNVCVPEIITVLGDARVDGEVLRNVTVVLGSARVSGLIHGDLVVFMGDLELTDTARVNGDVALVGGALNKAPGAVIEGVPFEVPLGHMGTRLRQWFRSGLFMARPLPPRVKLAWSLVGLHFLFYLLLSFLLPRPVAASVRELRLRPGPCFLVGLLSLILCVPLVLILSATGVGLLLVPLLLLLLTGAAFLGKTATLQLIGFRTAERFRSDARPAPLLGLLLGSVVVALVYMVPVLGLVAWGVLLPLALGAVLLGLAQNFHQQSAGSPSAPLFETSPSAPPRPTPDIPQGETSARPAEKAASAAASSSAPDAPPDDAPATASPAGSRHSAGIEWTPGTYCPIRATVESFSPAELATMPRAGFWIRLAATVLDFILLIWVLPVAERWFVPIWVSYHVALWTWKGTTIGGIVCGLKIIRLDGRPVEFTVALVRSLASVFSFAALGLGFFWVGWTRDRMAWHDRVAGTTIVKLPKGVSLI